MRAADIDLSFVPRRSAATCTEELDGECVILDEATELMHHLNATATVVWTCFDGSGTIAEIAADLARGFGTEVDRMQTQVLDLARDLGAVGLLDGIDPDPVDPHEPDWANEAIRPFLPPAAPE